MEERYKKLKRTLKLASLRRENEMKDQLQPMSISPMSISPSISSINAETLDSTSTIHSSVSKIGSELKTKGINNDHRMIVTSTVKKFNKENNCLEDHIIMPPPNVNRHVCSLKRLNNTAIHPTVKSSLQTKCYSSDIDTESPTKRENYRITNEDRKCNGSFNPLLIRCDSLQNSNVRIFTKWKVILNEQNQLIIKGRIEWYDVHGKMAWSKPIVRRLTSVKVESVFKHLYQLQGNLVDDEYDLPEYVRGKFHSGFPDDWKNVYQLWRSFVQQGCSATFRWPTPVADSDDDFTSVITEYITCTDSRNPKDKESNLKFHKESYAAVDSDCAYNNLQIRKNRSPSSYRYQTSDSFTQTNLSIGNISRTKTNIHSSGNQYNNDKENYEQQGDVNLNYSYTETVSNSLKDKLNAIVNNLDKNCPQEYISKIIEIFDCLKYVVSYRAIKEDGSNIEDSKLKTNEYMIKGQHNKINDTSQDYVESESISLLNSMGNRVDCSMSLQKKRTFTEMSRNDDINISDTESEIYAGVRKIPTGRIIQKETLLNPCKHKMRKKMYQKHDAIRKQNVSNVRPIMSNHNNESYIKSANFEGINDINFNDSNISDIEDERNHLEIKKYISSKNEDIILVDSENKDTQKIQKHCIQQNSTDAQSIQYLPDSYEVIKNNECGIDVTEEYNNRMTVANCYIQSNAQEKSRYMNDQCQNHSPGQQHEKLLSDSKRITTEKTKPVIIDSTLVNIKNTAIKELNEKSKNRSLTDKKSPKASTNLLRDSNQCSEDCVKSQSSNIDSIIPKKLLRDNLNVSRDNEASDSCKLRLLSAWTPRVLYKSGLHLIFEGKLLNEVGHVMNRKFQTDVISRRVSQKVVETVYHEFYQLIGDLNDTKHVVPKKLVNYCRYGCPTNIEQFCKMWKSSENDNHNDSINATENCNTNSVDSINVGVSSKGRKIIPPLSYWTERVALKDNSPVYNPGTSKKDPLIIFSPETVAKSKSVKTRKQRNEKIKKNTSETPKNDIKTVKRNASKRYIMKNKRQEELESSDSSDNENISIYKNHSKNIMNKCNTETINVENLVCDAWRYHKSHTNLVTTEPTVKKSKVRKDIESNTSLSSPFRQLPRSQSSAGKCDVVYTYYKDIPDKDDILSDDQVSHV
ncbi:hypothetical protein WN51_09082 [Melipona quadrifasciata]|uniref:SANTA domain-containing protein n=1 Tax=Melipona quadrifasciata TaxID=166423 RepID=A0A0M9A8A3_9HYME|nr:hypothetical protein WN51_09082 [Melipona quadrifasciata]